jgi:L-rhamnose mutarotase
MHLKSGENMIRKAFMMTVNPQFQEEYERRHNAIWDELYHILKSHGVHNYSIFLNQHTCQLFAYAEIEDEELWNQIADTPVCRKWWNYMSDIMPSNSDNSPISIDLKEVFHID